MTQLLHVEVAYDKPGLCPECLNLEITGRGGGKVHLIERNSKWVCPRSGPSLAQERKEQGLRATGWCSSLLVILGFGLNTCMSF